MAQRSLWQTGRTARKLLNDTGKKIRYRPKRSRKRPYTTRGGITYLSGKPLPGHKKK